MKRKPRETEHQKLMRGLEPLVRWGEALVPDCLVYDFARQARLAMTRAQLRIPEVKPRPTKAKKRGKR